MGDNNNNDDLFFSLSITVDGVVESEDALDFDEEKTIGELITSLKADYPGKRFSLKYTYEDEEGEEHSIKQKDMDTDMTLRALYTANGQIEKPTFYAVFKSRTGGGRRTRRSTRRRSTRRH